MGLTSPSTMNNEIGHGGFKTCHPAWLTSASAKELYQWKCNQNLTSNKRSRFQGSLEFDKIIIEANLHHYAVALTTFALGYIDRQIQNKGPPPDLPIPSLRFVEAGVFVALSNAAQHFKAGSGSDAPQKTYLLEEHIPISDGGDFIKYIHNGSPTPNISSSHPEYQTTLFLSTLQHIQYIKTHQYAYVSDYQSFGGILSDPQIMTSPTLLSIIYGPEVDGDDAAAAQLRSTLW
ncbi:hypothetical protein D9758_012549 [Tetrapyrgos nigripes]|uniref:Alpha-type protein kinase domain-containing protein n=1 Tax=Tetrapyrgos nigripes TaxID=182062 RepID=A0A8H5G3B6_9AGAR|nr:hypothetical protein D9758_012549 [Tetrapyrgos nigripes]